MLSFAGLATADCVSDGNWNFGLLGTKMWYAAVDTHGQTTVTYANQCLDMVERKCVPCADIRYSKYVCDKGAGGKCIITSIPASSRKRTDDMIETLVESNMELDDRDEEAMDPTPAVSGTLPYGHIIWSVKCGIDLGS